jgi:multimeric flavodoxin WrbA
MKINIYYGGRGLIEDSTLYVLQKVTEVLEELRVEVKRYNLYECKNEIAALSSSIKNVDGIILAANLEWYGIGGLLHEFLDACWLYADKERIRKIYMMPIVVANSFGEREAEHTLNKCWELLGGRLASGITAYVKSQSEFETDPDYANIIEKRAEDLYRTINQNPKTLPSSTSMLMLEKFEHAALPLTPEESEQLSKYVSDDKYVKKQKEDIEELSEMFSSLMGQGESGQEFIKNFKENYIPPKDDTKVIFELKMTDTGKTLVIDISKERLRIYYGECEKPDVVATTTHETINRIVNGRQTFQGAFMTGGLSAKGDFKVVRTFDNYFRFQRL